MKDSHQPAATEHAQQQTAPAKQMPPDEIWLSLTPQQQRVFIQKLETACRALLHTQHNLTEEHHDCR